MARYIDADKMVAKDNAYTTFPYDLAGCDDTDLVRWINKQPTAAVVPKSEVEQWYHEYHAIKDELKQEKMYHRETEKLADRYCEELQTAKSEVERLEKALADKARECNMAIDKICIEHRTNIALLHSSHEAELAAAKREGAWEIFAELYKMDIRIVRLRDAIQYMDLLKKYEYKNN